MFLSKLHTEPMGKQASKDTGPAPTQQQPEADWKTALNPTSHHAV